MDLLDGYTETPFRVTLPRRGERLHIQLIEQRNEVRFLKLLTVHQQSPWYTELPEDFRSNVFLVRFAGELAPGTLREWRTFLPEKQSPYGENKINICL